MAFDAQAGTKVGLEIWRIEKLNAVRVSESDFGAFHTGDCYLVLHTYKKNERSNKLDFDLHFWQGGASSQDERGASAYRTVELDDQLGGAPVQHREVQGHESARFMSYFPKGVRYLEGGVDTAFRKVTPETYAPRLFHIKGRRNVRSAQIALSAASLNEGDVFLLDAGLTLYQWNGSGANRQEKFKALELSSKIRDEEREGKAKLIVLESGEQGAEVDAFFQTLKGSPADVKAASAGGNDEAVGAPEPPALLRVGEDRAATEIAKGKLERRMLSDNDVFLVDSGVGQPLFVWVGKGASKEERAAAMATAQQYLDSRQRPSWTPVTRLSAGDETPAFRALFVGWDQSSSGAADDDEQAKERKLVLDGLLAKQARATETMLDDAASGSLTMWRIEDLKRVEVAPEFYGQFYAGDSFIVLYKYRIAGGGRESYVLYFWQGRESTTDEKTASALLTVELAGELSHLSGAQVRVVQNKEPQHFLALFKGKMVVREGGVAAHGGFARGDGAASSSSSSSAAGPQLFHIRGTSAVDTRAVQVVCEARNLSSGDCFVLVTPQEVMAWAGRGSNEAEQALARSLAQDRLAGGKPVRDVKEGEEPEEFWAALGGKAEYASGKHASHPPAEPRLFRISNVTVSGNWAAEEVENFTQDDLDDDDVYLLDSGAEVAVWVGSRATSEEREAASSMALEYVKRAQDGRGEAPVFRVPSGAEPPSFTCHFLGWSHEKAQQRGFEDPYAKKLAALKGGAAASSSSSSSSSSSAAVAPAKVEQVTAANVADASAGGKVYPLTELRAGCPAGVEASKKERYLSDEEFKTALGVDRAAFVALAGWKQAELKKKAGIF